MTEQRAVHSQHWRSDRESLETEERGPVRTLGAGDSEDVQAVLLEVVDAVRALATRALLRFGVTVESRGEYGCRAPQREGRAELAILVRAVIQGPERPVPLLWHKAFPRGAPVRWREELAAELPGELEATARAQSLERAVRTAVLLDSYLASQLIHECIGHTSEADCYRSYAFPAGYHLGYRWTRAPLTVLDDPLLGGHRGSFAVDDEGTPARMRTLIRGGVWSELLHTRESAELTAAEPGNARRVPGAERTLPRMSNTYALPGTDPLPALLASVSEGLYCCGTWGGRSGGLRFVIRPAYAQVISNGALTSLFIRRFDLRGHKFEALQRLVGIGDGSRIFDPVFGCDKDGQNGLAVSLGAPPLLFEELEAVPIAS